MVDVDKQYKKVSHKGTLWNHLSRQVGHTNVTTLTDESDTSMIPLGNSSWEYVTETTLLQLFHNNF